MIRGIAGALVAAALSVVSQGQTTLPAVPTAASDQVSGPAAVLARKISIRLEHATLKEAIDRIAAEGQVRIAYSRTHVPLDQRVSLVVDSTTVGDALAVLLRGSGIGVTMSPGGSLMLDRLSPSAGDASVVVHGQQPGGTITGAIVDSLTGGAVPYVIVRVDETNQAVTAGPQGHYTIVNVAPGDYHVTARRVGFIARTKPVTVEDGKVATVNFRLNQPPTKLAEIVTTALGDQRRYEVGNDIATINVDSVAPTAPATSLTDVITSRAPGVQVIETGGLAGSGNAIRIRGQSSMLLQGDPIIIVDGVRQDNTAGGTVGSIFSSGVPSPNRLNDIDFTQVETIDILKGPSASTEYGTDAANGVIVITTKRGTSGKTQWDVSADQDGSGIPVGFPEYYYSWGHLTDGTRGAVRCPVVPIAGGAAAANGPPFNTASSLGTCVVDSVTHFNPLNHSGTSLFGAGLRSKYDLSVSGGTEAIRYYVGGALSNEVGTVRLPPIFRPQALANGIPSTEFKPNGLDQRQLRATTTIRLGAAADLTVTSAYMSTYSNMPAAGLVGVATGYAVIDDSAHQYGYTGDSPGNNRVNGPLYLLGQNQHQQTDRVTGGMTASWRPLGWLTAHATLGIDHGSQNLQQRSLPEATIFATGGGSVNGQLAETQMGTDIYSADARASATASPWGWLRLTTSLGLQLADTRTAGLVASAQTTKAQQTLNGAAQFGVQQLGNRSATLGGYLEEGFNLFNALYWALAIRLDAGSGFGQAIHDAAYPKFDLSYAVLKSGPTTLRLRTALGAAGRQPTNGANRQLYDITQLAYLGGGKVSTGIVIGPGNPNLKPERSMEYEGGVDVGLWDSRVSVGLTGYWKSTKDALIDQILGFDLAAWPYEENIGDIRNSGLEATVSAMVLQSRALSWSVTISAATNHNKLLRVDPGFTQSVFDAQRQAVGYPLYGYWAKRYHYADANHDGLLQYTEMTVDDSASYVGSSLPTQEGSLTTHVGLFRNMFTVGALFSYAGGYKAYDRTAFSADVFLTSQTINDPHAPLSQQARALARSVHGVNNAAGYFEDGTFLRFRELSLTYTVPPRWVEATTHARSLSITGAVRNLALWTRFAGPDPESSDPGVNRQTGTINNDLRLSGANAVPLARYWFLRINLEF